MMRNILIMINYQREIPPFMIEQINYAKQIFDEVVYITPKLLNDNSNTILDKNVTIQEISNSRKLISIAKLPFMLVRQEVRKDFCKAIKSHRFNKSFVKHLLYTLIPADILLAQETKVARFYSDCKICMLASWFNCNAYAVAKFKCKNSHVTCASLAHAFEVNPERGSLIDLSLNEYKHKYLDRISFISRNVLNNYMSVVSRNNEISQNNIDVYYLGCSNNGINPEIKPDCRTLEILTCSSVNSIKRLKLIFEALEKWSFGKLHWTHIGNGPLFESLSKRANDLSSINEFVNVSFIGGKTNAEVHEYYVQHHIDLFLNVSSSEGLPVSLMEAISYGIPIVATDVGGTSEIANKQTGFLLARNPTPDQIISVLEQYVKQSEEYKYDLRISARKFWQEKFNSADNVTAYYKKLLTI